MQEVRDGHEVVIEAGKHPIAIMRPAEPLRGRLLSESIALAEARIKERGYDWFSTRILPLTSMSESRTVIRATLRHGLILESNDLIAAERKRGRSRTGDYASQSRARRPGMRCIDHQHYRDHAWHLSCKI